MRLSLGRKLVYGIALASASLLAVELAVRVLAPVPANEAFGATNWILHDIVSPGGGETHWIADPELLWRPEPHAELDFGWTMGFPESEAHASFALNAEGWRNPEIGPRRPGVRRVLHLGDSCTFGMGVENGRTYAERLPALLERRGAGAWESINAGVPSYSSYQGRVLLERHVERIAPDVVTLYFGWNDAWEMKPDAENHISTEGLEGRLARLLYRSEAFRRVRWAIEQRHRLASGTARVSVEDYRANLKAIIDRGRRDGFEVVLITGPAGPDPETRAPRPEPENRAYVEAMRALAADTGVALVDAARLFEERDELLFHDFIHPSARGHELIAESLAETLQRIAPDETPAAARRRDVLLVTADSLRHDRLGFRGHHRPSSPTLDRLAAQSIVFERGYAHAPWTVPSLGSLLTATYPGTHGAGHSLGQHPGLSEGMETLATRLAAAGFRTGAFVDSVFPLEKLGFARGFDRFEEGQADAREVARWLAEEDGPAFLWVHLLPPHAPYDAPAEDFLDGPPPADLLLTTLLPPECGGMADPAVRRTVEALYDANVREADGLLTELLEGLGASGRLDDALLIFSSDHGEELYEHGGCNHGHSVHDELLRVPLLLRAPWLSAARSSRLARHVDVLPTILDALGLEPLDAARGVSLLPGGRPADPALPPPADLYAEGMMGPERRTLIRDGFKVVCALVEDGRLSPEGNDGGYGCWLYDLTEDPDERTRLDDHPRLETLVAALSRYHLDAEARAPEPARVMWTHEEIERLAALGYVVE